MDFKINNSKRQLTNIPYVRSYDGANEVKKSNRYFNFCFRHKMSLLAVLFFIAIIVCFLMMIIYIYLQSEKGFLKPVESSREPEKSLTSKIEFEIEPKLKKAILALTDDETLICPDLTLFTQNDPEINRQKRQIPQNIPDCRSRQKECKIILSGLRSITKAVQQQLDVLQDDLVRQGILSHEDPKNAKFLKIVECLQCRNTISHLDEGGNNVNFLPGGSSQHHRIAEFLPYFEKQVQQEDDSAYYSTEESGERSDRIPKTPQHIVQSVTNNSKLAPNGAKITEILHNTTIVEDPPFEETNERIDPSLLSFFQGPVQVPDGMESQVTRNVDATPIILPTAETTKTSQQIQFTPQGSWPPVPVCFYGPPSSSNFYQYKPNPGLGSSFFLPFGQQQGINPTVQNQPSKYYFSNGQPQPFISPNYVPMMSAPQPTGSSISSNTFNPQQQQQFAPPGQRLYCTYLPAPTNFQLPQQPQQFSFVPDSPEFPGPFMVGSKNNDAEGGDPKSTYDESDEKYWVSGMLAFK